MTAFKIEGGRPLHGSITPQGTKNEALPALCAVLLASSPVTLHNVPEILDVQRLMALLEVLGVAITNPSKGTYQFDPSGVDLNQVDLGLLKQHATKIRGSLMLLGPLLARFGSATMPKPGGDRIGRRRLDTHFLGLSKLGATFFYDAQSATYEAKAEKLVGTYILLDEASVTGTANVIMAACLAQGTTTIYNAACEPHIQQLCRMLVNMGARIEHIGANLLTIHGVEILQGTSHTIAPDIIEIGSFISLAAMTMSNLTIKDAHVEQLGPVLGVFRKMGIQIDVCGDDLVVCSQEHYEIEKGLNNALLTIADAPWPGVPADLLSIILVAAVQAKGTVLIHQKMFESRLFFIDKLIEMGAQIVLCDPHRATVIGLDRTCSLRGINMSSPDIRAGISLLIAALSADGTSIIENIDQIDRGYESIDARLSALGASIERV